MLYFAFLWIFSRKNTAGKQKLRAMRNDSDDSKICARNYAAAVALGLRAIHFNPFHSGEIPMKRLLAFAALFAVLMGSMPSAKAADSPVDVRMAMRKLWEDHTSYTHQYVVSTLAGLPDAKDVADRLLRNQQDIGDAIKPYYGDEAGDKLASLLKDHIIIATKVVKEAKAGHKKQLDAAQKEWSQNGKDIAVFLSGANPDNWNESDLESMLQKHLDILTQQVVARLHKDWKADIEASDKGSEHMLMFADVLSDGVAKQFADKFASK